MREEEILYLISILEWVSGVVGSAQVEKAVSSVDS